MVFWKDWLNTSHVTTEVLDLYLNMAVTRETGHLTCWLFRNWVLGVLAENQKLKRIFKKNIANLQRVFFSFFYHWCSFLFWKGSRRGILRDWRILWINANYLASHSLTCLALHEISPKKSPRALKPFKELSVRALLPTLVSASCSELWSLLRLLPLFQPTVLKIPPHPSVRHVDRTCFRNMPVLVQVVPDCNLRPLHWCSGQQSPAQPAHFFLFFFCCWEKTPRIWSCWQKWKRKLAKSPTPNPCFFFEFWICLPKNESFHVFLLTSGWALLLYSRRPRSPMHMQGSSARAVGFRSNERIWFLTIGPKERKPSAVMLRALRMPPGEEFFHFSVSFQEFWTSVGKKIHKVLSRKAWKDCKTLFILAFLRFFPSMMGP